MTTLNGSYRYRVDFTKVVEPEDTEVLDDADDAILTLVTCYPFDFVGSAPQRFVVRAHRIPGSGKTYTTCLGLKRKLEDIQLALEGNLVSCATNSNTMAADSAMVRSLCGRQLRSWARPSIVKKR